jgi:hypothetical protein
VRQDSLRLDVGRPDHLGPLLGFFSNEFAEVGERHVPMVRHREDAGRTGVFANKLPDAPPMIPPEKPSRKEASKASKKKDKPASKGQRPQTAEKKLPTSNTTEAPKPQGAEPQSAPSQPTPSPLRTLWPEAPPAGTFSR